MFVSFDQNKREQLTTKEDILAFIRANVVHSIIFEIDAFQNI